MLKFHLWVWSTSTLVGTSIGALHEYRPNLHMCWSCYGLPVLLNWMLFFAWLLVYWARAAAFMVEAWYWMVHSRRVSERLSSRSSQLRSSILYVAIIGSEWAFAAVTFALLFRGRDEDCAGGSTIIR
jgi:hypothetical protein